MYEQFCAFLITIGIGMAAAFFFDFYRAVRFCLGLRRLGGSIADLVFWIFLTGIVFGLLLLGTWGDVRWYVLVGLAVGALLYRRYFTARGYAFWCGYLRFSSRTVRFACQPLVWFWQALTWPVRVLVSLFRRMRRSLRLRIRRPPPP
ncbi:MAG: hypothetical protein C4575_02290 [Desulforudis sp.]|nr:MAG: hypothetical protein C4575_02290 [Desulforudis sp.]